VGKLLPAAFFVVACSGAHLHPPTSDVDLGGGGNRGGVVLSTDGAVVVSDGGLAPECQFGGAPGKCMSASACAAIADHSAEPGSCPPATQCCIDAPDVADNPPTPTGYKLMAQSQVTPAMTNWAVAILHDPVTYPMWSTTTQTFGTQPVLARVEWHPPDFQNGVVHRGVTLYVPV
jgi:hypothetical protein